MYLKYPIMYAVNIIYFALLVTPEEMSVDAGDSGCLVVPTVPPKQVLYAVWPDDNNDSCICPLFYSDRNDSTLSDCQCYTKSSFKPTLSIGHNNDSQLCWSKVFADRNNSNVLFLTEGIVTDCDGKKLPSSFISKTLVSAAEFLVKGTQL